MKTISLKSLIKEMEEPYKINNQELMNEDEDHYCDGCGTSLLPGWEENGFCERCN